MIYTRPGDAIEPTLEGAPAGLEGTIGVRIIDAPTDAELVARTTVGIVERPAGSGIYTATLTAPADAGSYLVVWDTGGAAPTFAAEELVVTAAGAPAMAPAGPYLASREQLERYLRTAPAVGRQAVLDGELLDDVLAAASSRIVQAVPDRTLQPVPAGELDPPVAVTFTLRAQTLVQVPDLRVLEAATIDGRELDPLAFQLRRRRGELCALWARLPGGSWASPLTGELELVGRWGPANARVGDPLEVDPAIREACVVWAGRAYWNRAARFADNVTDPAGATVSGYFRNLPPDVKLVLDGLAVPGL
jgi:hypothetical protein